MLSIRVNFIAGSLAWGGAALVFLFLLGGGYYAYRYYQRRQRLDPLDDHESAEPLNGMSERKAPPPGSSNLPWWNWRRWTGEDESQYFPLADRSHGRERTE